LVAILGDNVVKANFVQFNDFAGLGVEEIYSNYRQVNSRGYLRKH